MELFDGSLAPWLEAHADAGVDGLRTEMFEHVELKTSAAVETEAAARLASEHALTDILRGKGGGAG